MNPRLDVADIRDSRVAAAVADIHCQAVADSRAVVVAVVLVEWVDRLDLERPTLEDLPLYWLPGVWKPVEVPVVVDHRL